jgi:hypothetical protein
MGRGSKKKDIFGQKFGKLTAIEFIEVKNNNTLWFCQCDCENKHNC